MGSKGPPFSYIAVDGELEYSTARDKNWAQALHPPLYQLCMPCTSTRMGNKHGDILAGLPLRSLLGKSCCCCCAARLEEENVLRRKVWSWEGSGRLLNCLRGEVRDELKEQEPVCPCRCVCTGHRLREFRFPGPGETEARGCEKGRAGCPPQHQQLDLTGNSGFAAQGPD